jgi:mycothiol synthase
MGISGSPNARLSIRAADLSDLDRAVALLARHADETGDDRVSATELRSWWTAPEFDLRWQVLVAEAGGELVGYADIGDPNGDRSQLWIDLRVPTSGRTLHADGHLLDGVLEHARLHTEAGALLRGFSIAQDDHTIALFEGRGFAVVRHSIRMAVSLAGYPPEPKWPAGISMRTANPESDLRPVYDAYHEAFADAWGGVEEPYADFLHGWGVGGDFDPTLWFLAEDDGALAGVALCRPERGGEIDLGWVSVLGVRRPWRRRGLGRALLLHAFHELRRRGKARVGLGVDAESPTGAVALYEGVGMTVTRRSVTLERRA